MNALNDIVVLDLTRFEAGPRCTYVLEQLGAYIIKIEKSWSGDDERLFPPMYKKESLAFPTFNLNKKSLGMDLRNPKAMKIIFDLLPKVDVVIQNFRAGTIEKMGLDWETIHKINPRIIMANNSGFGQTGPYRDRTSVDAVAQCETGLSGSFTARKGKPVQCGGYPIDHQTAIAFASSIIAAILQRDRTGEGQYLEVDMFSMGLSMLSPNLAHYKSTGITKPEPHRCPNNFYKDKDGKYVEICCPDEAWEGFKKVVGSSELEDECFADRTGRAAAAAKLDDIIGAWTAQYAREEIREKLETVGVGVGILKAYDELLEDAYLKEADYFRQVNVPFIGEVPYHCMPFTLSGGTMEYNSAPMIGENNFEILHKFLGYSEERVKALTEEGVLYFGEHACLPPRK